MKFLHLLSFLCLTASAHAQVSTASELFKTLFSKDSLLFEVAFNQCDLSPLEYLISEDLEFYHDQSGITSTKDVFIAGIRDGICNLDYRPRRELVAGSLEVFPLHNQGELYGAIQRGEHRFYAKYEGKPEEMTSVASFTHLWLVKAGQWKLSRVLSYDHHSPE